MAENQVGNMKELSIKNSRRNRGKVPQCYQKKRHNQKLLEKMRLEEHCKFLYMEGKEHIEETNYISYCRN